MMLRFLLLALFAATASAQTVEVVSNVAELLSAVSTANASGNYTIRLNDGTYSLTSEIIIANDDITIESVSGNRNAAIIEGDSIDPAGGIIDRVIYVFSGNNFTVQDVTLQTAGAHALQIGGNDQSTDGLLVDNVVMLDAYDQILKGATAGTGTVDNGVVQNSYFAFTAGIAPDSYTGGIDVHFGDNWRVVRNVFEDIKSPNTSVGEHAIHFWEDANNVIIEQNVVLNSDRGIGCGLDAVATTDNCTIRNNFVYHDGSGVFQDVGIGIQNTTGARVYNNTVWLENYSNGIEIDGLGTNTAALISNNLTNQSITERFSPPAPTYETNNTAAQSGWFVDYTSGNLRLASSVASVVDQGTPVTGLSDDIDQTARPQGAGIDIGAHEYFTTRLLPSDFEYRGAFMVPETAGYVGMAAIDGSSSISYYPGGDPSGGGDGYPGSLFLNNEGFVAELTIPAPIESSNFGDLTTATEIQSASDITSGAWFSGNDRFGGVVYVGPKGATDEKLYWAHFEYYNVDTTDYDSIGWSSIDLGAPNAQGPWHVGPNTSDLSSPYHGNKHGDYLFPIDQSWADQYTGGRSLLTGRYKEAGSAGGSMGPVLIAIAPWQDGNPPSSGSELSALPLMSFETQTGSWGENFDWREFLITNDPDYIYHSPGDRWHGGAWVSRGAKRAIVLVGRHGTYDGDPACPPAGADGCHGDINSTTPPYCYGDGGTECPYGIAVTSSKGYHVGPYLPRFLLIDPDELAEVAQAIRTPESVGAYASYNPSADFPWSDSDGFNDLAGAAYDSANGFFYVAQANAYRPGGGPSAPWPVIHVYEVMAGEGVDTTPPGPVENLQIEQVTP